MTSFKKTTFECFFSNNYQLFVVLLLGVFVASCTYLPATPPLFDASLCRAGDATACVRAGNTEEKGDAERPPSLPTAFDFYRRACELHHAAGCFNLGLLYYKGGGVTKNLGRARALWKWACRAGEGAACYNYGVLQNERGTPEGIVSAGAFYRLACDLDYSQGCKALGATLRTEGMRLLRQKKPKDAQTNFRYACALNDGAACTHLGSSPFNEEGQEANSKSYLKKACRLGNARGCAALAFLIETQSKEKSVRRTAPALYRKACSLGHVGACVTLAEKYARAARTSPMHNNVEKSAYYYGKACSYHNGTACYNAGQIHFTLLSAPKRARHYYKEACRLGIARACRIPPTNYRR